MTEQKLPGSLSVYRKRGKYGAEFDPDYCAASVASIGGFHWHQCRNKWKVDKRGHRWCGVHDPDNVEARRAKQDARWEAKQDKKMAPYRRIEELEAVNADLLEALKLARAIISKETDLTGGDYSQITQAIRKAEEHREQTRNT